MSGPDDTAPGTITALPANPQVGVSPAPRNGLPWVDGSELCAQVGADMFFADDEDKPAGDTSGHPLTWAALRVCRACPLVRPCLTHALRQPESYGVWGASTESWRMFARRDIQAGRRDLESVVDEALARHHRKRAA